HPAVHGGLVARVSAARRERARRRDRTLARGTYRRRRAVRDAVGARRAAAGDRGVRTGAGAPERREHESLRPGDDVNDDFSLTGQVAFVTGSGRGLGHAIARRLAELGAGVAVHDRDEQAPAEFGEFADLAASQADVAAVGSRTCLVAGDIASESRVTEMARDVERALGPITILVNAAGGDIAAAGGKPKPNNALEIKMEDVRALIDRNLIGTMLMCRAVVPGMIARRAGAVVNIASAAAHIGVSPEVVYSTIKAAIVH